MIYKRIPFTIISIVFLLFLTSCSNAPYNNSTNLSSEEENMDSISTISYDALYPIILNGYVEYMNPSGEVVTNYKFDKGGFMCDGMAIVCKDNLFGAINSSGKLTVPLQNLNMSNFSCGLALAKNSENYYGYIDSWGNVVIPFEYDNAQSFSEDIAIVSKGNITYFIDPQNNVLYEENNYLYFSPYFWGGFHEGLTVNGNAYYDIYGKCVIKNNIKVNFAEGVYPDSFYEGFAVYPQIKEVFFEKYQNTDELLQQFFISENWYSIYIDKNGINAFGKRFESAGRFSEGLAVAELDGKYGCIDQTGEFLYYNDGLLPLFWYSNGRIEFISDNKFGFLDKSGNVAVEPIYTNVESFMNGLALVEDDNWFYYINPDGEIIHSFDKPEKDFLLR